MVGVLAHRRPQRALDAARATPIVEEGDVLRPPEPGQHAQPVVGGDVEEPGGRRRVRAHGVEAGGGDLGEVPTHDRRRGKQRTVGARPERAVRHPSHP